MTRKKHAGVIAIVLIALLLVGLVVALVINKATEPADQGPTATTGTATAPTDSSGNIIPTDPGDDHPSSPSGPGNEDPSTPSEPGNEDPSTPSEPGNEEPSNPEGPCTLEYSRYGRYTGIYVEDGTDEYVQNVAILLITNTSGKYLEYAAITFDISGNAAVFAVTGLRPGESAWVMEKNRLTIETDAVFTYKDDVLTFAEDNGTLPKNIEVSLGDGQLSVENNTGKNVKNVYVYFKTRHSDGNFLGGITYRVPMGDMNKGETLSAIAAHCDPTKCEVVRVDWEE